jgi:hypothetical protein
MSGAGKGVSSKRKQTSRSATPTSQLGMDQEGSEDEDEAVHASSKLRRVSEDAGTSDAKGGAVQ